ncbi:MAG: hypothetical protein E7258_09715 [Lachnospiraceae bacterium]|nr:hypothetical protein [Lachnospiraceae bacterium]
MKKTTLLTALLVICMCLMTACGKEKPLKTYTYNHEEILEISIEKTMIYSDKLVIEFSEDSLYGAEEVVCYDDDFNIMDDIDCSVAKDKITIHTECASQISGLYIRVNFDKEINVRYLDSDNYAMIVYIWADDIGMMPNGDLDTYYTEKEKRERAEREAELEAAEAEAFSLIEGIWENDEKTLRLEIMYVDENRVIKVYEEEGVNSGLPAEIPIDGIDVNEESEPVEVIVYDNVSWGAAYCFYLYNDNIELKYYDSDIVLKKIQ